MSHSSSQALFPIRSKLYDDESFSSWFSRLAVAHGVSGQSLASIICERRIAIQQKRDLDRSIDEISLQNLSNLTKIPIQQLLGASLSKYVGYLFSETPKLVGMITWIRPYWNTLTNKKHGMQFCWRCLKEDITPYFRLKWRLSFVVSCTKHKIILSDQCPKCSEPIDYFRTSQEYSLAPIHICRMCGFDIRNQLTEIKSDTPSDFEVKFQKHLEDVLEAGWVENQIGSTYSHLYFDGLYLMMRSLCGKSAKRFCELVANFYKVENVSPELFDSVHSSEMRSITERRILNILIGHLINNWHEDFVKLCEDNKIRFKELIPFETGYFPFWYWKVIDEYLYRPYLSFSDIETDSFYNYVKSQGNSLNTIKIREQFGVRYYSAYIRKKRQIAHQKTENSKCIYCHDTHNQKIPVREDSLPLNRPRNYCKICERTYIPNHLPKRSFFSPEIRKKAVKLLKEGMHHFEVAETLSVSRTAVKHWLKMICIRCQNDETQLLKKSVNSFRFFCKICKQHYKPHPLPIRAQVPTKNLIRSN